MSQLPIGITLPCGNATDATIYTVPARTWSFISCIIVTNTTAGPLNLLIKIGNRVGLTYTIQSTIAVGANTTTSFCKGTTTAIAPLVMNAGETFLAQASGTGVNMTIGGINTTLPT